MRRSKKLALVLFFSLLSIIILANKQGFDIFKNVKEMNIEFLFLAGASFLMYLLMESLAFKYLLNKFGYLPKLKRTFYYAASDFFASSISPGGSAGQPVQYMAMTGDNISTADTVMSLFSYNAVYHVMMLLLAGVTIITGEANFIHEIPALKIMCIYGTCAQLFFVCVLVCLMFSKRKFPKIIKGIFEFLWKFEFFKKRLGDRDALDKHFEEQKMAGKYLKEHPIIFIRLMMYILPLLIFYYSVPYCVFKGFGVDLGYIHAVSAQFITMLAIESIPLPGGVGVVELGASSVYDLFAPGMGFVVMVFSRTFNFYFGLLIGGLTVSLTKSKSVKITKEKQKSKELYAKNFLEKRRKKKDFTNKVY